jgi:glycosyltransferase involved in cell wall biosynthesis
VTIDLVAPPADGPLAPRDSPTFAVLIPAYEALTTLDEAIDSVLAQTYPAAEIVICDDGSADPVASHVARYGDRVSVVRQENRGLAGARNTAARNAHSEFLVLLDADDLFAPTRLAALAEAIVERPDLDVITTDANVEVEGRIVRRNFDPSFEYATENQREEILDRCFVGVHWAIRRATFERYDGFDEAIRSAEDWDFAIRLIRAGARFGLIDEPLSSYRLQPGSLSNQAVGMLRGLTGVVEKTLRRSDLSDRERRFLERRLARLNREIPPAELSEAIFDRAPDARRVALRVARAPGLSVGSRLRAAVCALSPVLARRILARRGRATAGALTLPVD